MREVPDDSLEQPNGIDRHSVVCSAMETIDWMSCRAPLCTL